jgi:heme exporter protein A
LKIIAENISKHFNRNYLFRDLNFEVGQGECLAVLGANGSGKTTLIKILCALQRPSSGKILYENENLTIKRDEIYSHIGLVSPYLELYEELTAKDNLDFFADIKGLDESGRQRMREICGRFKIADKMHIRVKAYSSGMKQRLKYVLALMDSPQVLFIDEPRTNLDEEGIKTVYNLLGDYKKKGVLIIATNEKQDLVLADKRLTIDS